MNALTHIDRQAVELARYQSMVDALLSAIPNMRDGTFYESPHGLDAVRAINDFLSGEPAQDMIDVIAGNLPDHPVAEDSDPFFGQWSAPFARALGGR